MFGSRGASQISSDHRNQDYMYSCHGATQPGHPSLDPNGGSYMEEFRRTCPMSHCTQGKHRLSLLPKCKNLGTDRSKQREQANWNTKMHLCVCPLPSGWAATLHVAFLLLCTPLFADKLRQPSHLQNPPLQSHLPRSQQDLLPENEEKSLREQERRAETKGAETLQQLKNKHRRDPSVYPQNPPCLLISDIHNGIVLG